MKNSYLKIAVLTLLAIMLLVSCGGSKASAKGKVIKFGTDATWPPMEFVNDNKELIGFDIDLVKAMGVAGEFTPEFQIVSWDGIFGALDNKQYDAIASSLTITEERKQKVDFTAPYVKAGQHLLVPVSTADETSLATMGGTAVGIQIGTAAADEVKKFPEINMKEYPEIGLALQDLVNGNLQGVVCDSPVAIDYALQNPNFKGKIKIVGDLMTSEDLGFAVRKGDAATLALLNSSLEKVKASGKLDEIKAKWGLK